MDLPCDHFLDVDDIWGAEWLRSLFRVAKYNPEHTLAALTKKERVWGLDFFMRSFAQMQIGKTGAETWSSQNSDKSKTHVHSSLYRAERDQSDEKRLRLRFFKAEHPYDLVYSNGTERQRFYELAKALRMFPVWCPSLCGRKSQPSMVEIKGKLETNMIGGAEGERHVINGACKLRMFPQPYEEIKVWTGTKDLRGAMPNPGDLHDWMPVGAADFYVTCFVDIPTVMQKCGQLGEMVTKHLGDDYVPLLSTELESGKRTVAMTVVCQKTKALRISQTGAWTGSLSRSATTRTPTLKQKMGIKNRAESMLVDLVALNLSINETSLLFVGTKMALLSDDEGEASIQLRNGIIKDLLTKLEIGPSHAGDTVQKSHHAFFMGGLEYGAEVENHNWQRLSMLPRNCDRLTREIQEERCLAGFKEADLVMNHQLNEENLKLRILWKSQLGTKVIPLDNCYKAFYQKQRNLSPAVSNIFAIPTLLTYVEAFSTPCPLQKFSLLNVELVCSQGAPGACEMQGKTLPQRPVIAVWCDFSDGPTVKMPMTPSTETPLGYMVQALPPVVPATHSREYLKKQYLWVSILSERDECYGTGVVSLDASMTCDDARTLPLEIKLLRAGIDAGAKITFLLQVDKDDTPVRNGIKVIEEKEPTKRSVVSYEEQTGWEAIMAQVQSSMESASHKMNRRFADESTSLQDDEEDQRVDIEEEEEDAFNALQNIALNLNGSMEKHSSERQTLDSNEGLQRSIIEGEEAAAWSNIIAFSGKNMASIGVLYSALDAVVKEEGIVREALSVHEENDWKNLLATCDDSQREGVELFEDMKRNSVLREEQEAWEALVGLREQDLELVRRAEITAAAEKQMKQREAMIDMADRGREGIEAAEEEARKALALLMVQEEQGVHDAARRVREAKLQKQRDEVAMREAPPRKAIMQEEQEAWNALIDQAVLHRKEAEALTAKRLTGLESYRREIMTEEADIRDEILSDEQMRWELLMKEAQANRHQIRLSERAEIHRMSIESLVKLQHQEHSNLLTLEHEAWVRLMEHEQLERTEARDYKLARYRKERLKMSDEEQEGRSFLALKEATAWAELSQAMAVENEAAGRREQGRTREEIDARNYLILEEAQLWRSLMSIEREERKNARRVTQSRVARELKEVTDMFITEEAMRGDIAREELKGRELIVLDVKPIVKVLQFDTTIQNDEQVRTTREVPWTEEQHREDVIVEEDAAWWDIVHLMAVHKSTSSEATLYNKMCPEFEAAREALMKEEDAAWEALMEQHFAGTQEVIRSTITTAAEAKHGLDTIFWEEEVGRRDAMVEEGAERESIFMLWMQHMRGVIEREQKAEYTRVLDDEIRSKKAAKRKTEKRQLFEEEVFWGETIGRTILCEQEGKEWEDLLRVEPRARQATGREPQSEVPAEGYGRVSPSLPEQYSEEEEREEDPKDDEPEVEYNIVLEVATEVDEEGVEEEEEERHEHEHEGDEQVDETTSETCSNATTLTPLHMTPRGLSIHAAKVSLPVTPLSSFSHDAAVCSIPPSVPPYYETMSYPEVPPTIDDSSRHLEESESISESRSWAERREARTRTPSELAFVHKAVSPEPKILKPDSYHSSVDDLYIDDDIYIPIDAASSPATLLPSGVAATADACTQSKLKRDVCIQINTTDASATSQGLQCPATMQDTETDSRDLFALQDTTTDTEGLVLPCDTATETTDLAPQQDAATGTDCTIDVHDTYEPRAAASTTRLIIRLRTLFEEELYQRSVITLEESIATEMADWAAFHVVSSDPVYADTPPDELLPIVISDANTLKETFPVTTTVEASGLRRSVQLNGAHGTVVGYEHDRVLVNFGTMHPVRGIRPENLTPVPDQEVLRITSLTRQLETEKQESMKLREQLKVLELTMQAQGNMQAMQVEIQETQTARVYEGEVKRLTDVQCELVKRNNVTAAEAEALRVDMTNVIFENEKLKGDKQKLQKLVKQEKQKRLEGIEQANFEVQGARAELGKVFGVGAAVETSGDPMVPDSSRGVVKELEGGEHAIVKFKHSGERRVALRHLKAAKEEKDELEAANREISRLQNLLKEAFAREDRTRKNVLPVPTSTAPVTTTPSSPNSNDRLLSVLAAARQRVECMKQPTTPTPTKNFPPVISHQPALRHSTYKPGTYSPYDPNTDPSLQWGALE